MEIVFNSNVGFNPINIEMLIIIVRVYLFCIIIVLLQILLLLKTTKVNTYMILTSISIILAFMSYYSFKLECFTSIEQWI